MRDEVYEETGMSALDYWLEENDNSVFEEYNHVVGCHFPEEDDWKDYKEGGEMPNVGIKIYQPRRDRVADLSVPVRDLVEEQRVRVWLRDHALRPARALAESLEAVVNGRIDMVYYWI